MSRITRELLQKRAEHNEKVLTTLEEISLHQQEILKIENIDVHCRHIKILLLQNNIIDKMENLNKLKELEYLNLALNNIAMIENIEGCESLQKLDLTVNFVGVEQLEQSVQCLQKCQNIKELYLTGNPCTDWSGFRDYVISQVSTLQMLDGKEIFPSERIKAIQILPQLKQELLYQIELEKIKNEQKEHEKQILKEQQQEEKKQEEEKSEYTRESRREIYLKMAKDKEDEDRRKHPEKYIEKQETPIFTKEGRVRQCDEGGYKPILNQWDDPCFVVFKMNIPKFLDTSLVDVQLNPFFVSVRVKGKLTQLRLDEEIQVEKSTIQRSQITGELIIKMPKIQSNYVLQRIIQKKKDEEEQKKNIETQKKIEQQKNERERTEKMIQTAEKKALQNPRLVNYDQTTFDDIPELE